MKTTLGILVAFVFAIGAANAQEAKGLDGLDGLVNDEAFWALPADDFMTAYQGQGFRWTSADKGSARSDGKRTQLQMLGSQVGETIVLFNEGVPKQLQVSIYNRGDNGEIQDQDKFAGIVTGWKSKLTELSGVPAVERGKDNKSAVRAEGFSWTTDTTAYLLEFSYQREIRTRNQPFRGEFVRLRAAKVVKKSFMEEALAKETRVSRADLPSNVVKENGDVYIKGIPMVDQGDKGYCVVASTARVFGYYDMQVDQHEIAQIANSSADGGTSTKGMVDALDDIAGRFKVRVKTHDEMEYDDVIDLSEDYNRAAKRAGKPEVPEGGNNNLWYNFDRFDGDVLKEARLRSTAGIKRFKSEIERSIDVGVPLLWTVTVGIYEEPKRISQSRGGHMRMIIGYNWDKNEVIFSDSWGAGHEMKRWGVEEAFCSSKGLYSVQPIK